MKHTIPIQPHIASLFRWFSQTGKPLFLVGGCVRNELLGYAPGDLDVCAAVTPQEIEPFSDAEFTVAERSYGLGTVLISQRYGGDTFEYEYTAFRRDSYGRCGEHRPARVYFTRDIAEDAARRDFTVNALYAGADGAVADPLGRGLADLWARRIRMCGPETLTQDALRILRMARFAAELGFAVEEETLAAAKANARKLADISAERKRDELFKLLLADTKYGNKTGVMDGLALLREVGALPYALPELAAGEGFAQAPEYHKYDVLEHSFASCAAAPPDLTVRLAALLHDVAKPVVYAEDGNLYRHPREGALLAGEALRRLRVPKKLESQVTQLVAAHMFDLDNRAGETAVARMVAKLGREQFLRLIELREADFTGSGRGAVAQSAKKWRAALEKMEQEGAPIDIRDMAVDGGDIIRELGIEPGPRVGDILCRLHILALKKPSQNNYKSLIKYAKMVDTPADRTQSGE